MSREFDFLSARRLRELVASRAVSPVDLVRAALDKAQASHGTLNAFSVLRPDAALEEAREAEVAVLRGDRLGPLHGLPISVKDLIALKGERFASGSRAMASNVASVDAPAVERVRAAGAIVIGKTTTSEFGCKAVGDSPLTGITRHPWNLDKTPGGSSAGAAASVAASITPLALGTDGGGSLRIPAALTGLVGFKAQAGRVPVWPTSATPTLAHVGALARNVGDAALLTTVMAGYDARDPFSVAGPMPDLAAASHAPLDGLRVAWSSTLGYARPAPDVVAATRQAAEMIGTLGAVVEEVDAVFERDPCDIWTAEFYAGVGTRLRDVLRKDRALLDPAVAAVLDDALRQEMTAYYETVFRRYALRETMRGFFERYNVLLSPTLPVSSVPAGVDVPPEFSDRTIVSWVFYTYPFNLTGQPAASICAGFGADGMPVGLQIVGRLHGEADVMRVAGAFEATQPEGYNLRPFLT